MEGCDRYACQHVEDSFCRERIRVGESECLSSHMLKGFSGGSVVKKSTCQRRRQGFDPWVGKIPWRWKWQPTPVFLPGKLHGHKSLMGYSSLACKEFTTSECVHCSHTPPPKGWSSHRRVRNYLKIRQNSGQKPSSVLRNPTYRDPGSVLTDLDPWRVPCEDKREHRSIFGISDGTVWHQLAQTCLLD